MVGITLLSVAMAQWDQKAAVARVKQVLAIEQQGQPWDDVSWELNAAAAVRRATREQKPILVFFYLSKQRSKSAAPC
jgi:hypothetical protein